jgi:phosphate transport system substrate-binding protein
MNHLSWNRWPSPPFLHGFFACVAMALCAPSQGREVVRVGGTGAGAGALQALAKAYERRHPDHSVQVLPSIGSSGGIRAVIDGKLEVGCTSRPLKAEEWVPGLVATPWATTPFVFATQASTPAEALTLSGIEDIYAGRRTQWKDGRPIRLVLRPKSDAAHAYLSQLTPGMPSALDHAHALAGVCVGMTDQDALAYIEKTPGSFGTTVLGLIVSEGRKVQALAIDGASPMDKRYGFALTLTLVHRPALASSATRGFLEFVGSKDGGSILVQAGYLPLPTDPPRRGK